MRVPWIARRSNLSIPKEISPEYSLEGPMLKLKLQYFGHMMRRADSLEKTLMLGLFISIYIFNNSLDVKITLNAFSILLNHHCQTFIIPGPCYLINSYLLNEGID